LKRQILAHKKEKFSKKNDLGQLLKLISTQMPLFERKKFHFRGEQFTGEIKFLTFEGT